VDDTGQVLSTFTDVREPIHLSIDSRGRVLVTDRSSRRVLLLNSQLQRECILIDANSQVNLKEEPDRSYYSELTSQLYIAHGGTNLPSVISLFTVR